MMLLDPDRTFWLALAGLALILPVVLAACGGREASPDPAASLRGAIEALAAQHPEGLVAVAVRDPQTGVSLDVHADSLMHAASTMKVPVMIEVHRQAAAGRFALDDSIEVRNAFRSIVDGSPYSMDIGEDSDDAIYDRLGERMTIRQLVYQMITVSSNLATNLLIDLVSADSVQHTIERLGTRRMRVLRGVEDLKAYHQGLNNTATAADLAALMDALRRSEAVSATADSEMIDVLLAQHFNDMIPVGLPEDTAVAHKTGWITAIHHDAAIVYPAAGKPYVLVVLTRGIEDADVSATLVADVARTVHAALRPQ